MTPKGEKCRLVWGAGGDSWGGAIELSDLVELGTLEGE